MSTRMHLRQPWGKIRSQLLEDGSYGLAFYGGRNSRDPGQDMSFAFLHSLLKNISSCAGCYALADLL